MAKLFLTLADPEAPTTYSWGGDIPLSGRDSVKAPCEVEGCPYGSHERLWEVRRVLVDTLGHFPVFRLNGEKQVIDGSLPTIVERLPRDAREIKPERVHAIWCDTSGSHVFGTVT